MRLPGVPAAPPHPVLAHCRLRHGRRACGAQRDRGLHRARTASARAPCRDRSVGLPSNPVVPLPRWWGSVAALCLRSRARARAAGGRPVVCVRALTARWSLHSLDKAASTGEHGGLPPDPRSPAVPREQVDIGHQHMITGQAGSETRRDGLYTRSLARAASAHAPGRVTRGGGRGRGGNKPGSVLAPRHEKAPRASEGPRGSGHPVGG